MVSTPLLSRIESPRTPPPSPRPPREQRWNDSCKLIIVAFVVGASLSFFGTNQNWFHAASVELSPVGKIGKEPGKSADYELAYKESLGFLDDIPSKDWEMMRGIALNRVNHDNPQNPMAQARNPSSWYQNNFDPDFSCRHDTKVGVGDGGKWVCDPLRLRAQSQRRMGEYRKNNQTKVEAGCLVYSIGSEGNFRFEEGVFDLLGPGVCEIHTFDFGNYASRVPPNKGIHFHQWGLKPSYKETKGTRSGRFGQQVHGAFKTLEQTMRELGHEGRPIDIYKIDCEGCEWGTYKDWLKADIRQILLEVHEVPQVANDFFMDMQRAGYVTFHKEPNIQYAGGSCVEYAMLKLSPDFIENRLTSTNTSASS